MGKYALVIASQTAGLEGPAGDARSMAAMLREYAFDDVDLRVTAQDASRDGIIDGYRKLIARFPDPRATRPDGGADPTTDDAAVVYYSGHGVRVVPQGKVDPDARQSRQAIVPTDFFDSKDDRFLGITDAELSSLLHDLTARISNVTVILDCCHAAAMSRDVHSTPKSLLHATYLDLERHLERVKSENFHFDDLEPINDKAVRLVAAGESQSAYERLVGKAMVGTFTESIVMALREARAHADTVTWDQLGRTVRERVLGIHQMQRPDIEGPRRRYLFQSLEAPSTGAVTIIAGDEPDRAVLRAGRLQAVCEGDEYAVLPNAAAGNIAGRVATARVTRVGAIDAAATLAFVAPAKQLPDGAQAFPMTSAAPRRAVRLSARAPARDEIAAAIESTGRFDVIDGTSARAFLASVELDAGQLAMTYPSGVPVVPPMTHSDANVRRVVTNLRMLTAAQALRDLRSNDEDECSLPETAVEITWGRVEDGEAVVLEQTGAVIAAGARTFVRVKNNHPQQKKLFVAVFDIGVAQRVQHLTSDHPAGFELEYGRTFTLGQTANGTLKGLEMGWSSELPEDLVRSETFVVMVTDRRCDLSALETPGATADWARQGMRSVGGNHLEQLAAQLQLGTPRDAKKGTPRDTAYLVRQIDFEMSPWPLPQAGEDFLLDDRPPASVCLLAPRALRKIPSKVAVRITGLAIHDTRAWFGSADIRLDTLVITRLPDEAGAPYRAETHRFKDIRDGEQLPLENALVYHGEARDFLDIRVWVSRDRDDSKSLTELLKEQATSAEFRESAATLLAATAAAPATAAVVAVVGAAATLTAITWRVLSAALPKTIGIYETSLLAAEGAGFGQGRHPPQGMHKAQGFSFGYEVVGVD